MGLIFAGLILVVCDLTPVAVQKKARQEAVDRGFADWLTTTNGEVYFEWKKKTP